MNVEDKLENNDAVNIKVRFDDLISSYGTYLVKSLAKRMVSLKELAKATDNDSDDDNSLGSLISVIQQSHNEDDAKNRLMKYLKVSLITADIILDTPVSKLESIHSKAVTEYNKLVKALKDIEPFINDRLS